MWAILAYSCIVRILIRLGWPIVFVHRSAFDGIRAKHGKMNSWQRLHLLAIAIIGVKPGEEFDLTKMSWWDNDTLTAISHEILQCNVVFWSRTPNPSWHKKVRSHCELVASSLWVSWDVKCSHKIVPEISHLWAQGMSCPLLHCSSLAVSSWCDANRWGAPDLPDYELI